MKRHRLGAPPLRDSSSDDDEGEDAFAALSSRQKSSSNNKRAKSAEAPASSAGAAAVAAAAPPPSNHPTSISNAASAGLQQKQQHQHQNQQEKDLQQQQQQQHQPSFITSSMKRHHVALSDTRKAKLDAMLVELQRAEHQIKPTSRDGGASATSSFVPHKKGSFVESGQEHSTTNLFVGNLDPHITEEQLGDVFRQFGDLYSLKIMWPRSEEERLRNRISGFVCFLHRSNAETAFRALDDTDPFGCGRRISIRWGKDIRGEQRQGSNKDEEDEENINKKRSSISTNSPASIRVQRPQNPRRARFIDTVAEFVAQDGSRLERLLFERERENPEFDFLFPTSSGPGDHAYYKWKVYSLCQGGGTAPFDDVEGSRMRKQSTSAPFPMLLGGCLWIPPSTTSTTSTTTTTNLAASSSSPSSSNRKQVVMSKKRTDGTAKLDAHELAQAHQLFRVQLCASRQAICQAMAFCFEKTAAAHHIASLLQELFLEVASTTTAATANYDDNNNSSNDRTTKKQKKTIHVSVETLISRLYLLSDILFNSQQPTIKNAFLYRMAVESMAPSIFASLGDYTKLNPEMGRFTLHKLTTAVHVVLQAWSSWNVFHHSFLEELQSKFEGREPTTATKLESEKQEEGKGADEGADSGGDDYDKEGTSTGQPQQPEPVREIAQGQWTVVDEESHEDSQLPTGSIASRATVATALNTATATEEREEDADGEPLEPDDGLPPSPPPDGPKEKAAAILVDADGEPLVEGEDDPDGELLVEGEDDPDGEYLVEGADDPDGELLVEGEDDPDGEYLVEGEDDPDGEPLEDDGGGDDADGVPLDDDVDGAPVDDDADGVALDDDADAEGAPLDDDADTDGVPLNDDADGDEDDADGVPLDEDDIDGEA